MLPELTPVAIRDLIGRDDPHILEIGANDGSDTLGFLQAFPKGRVSCFECDPRAIATWRRRIHLDHPRATLYETALGERCGRATFYQSGGKPPGVAWEGVESWDKSGSLLPPDRHQEFHPWIRFPSQIDVAVTTLDAWHDGTIIDFVWMDVQGGEAAVLRGAQRTVRRCNWIYLECHTQPNYCGQPTLRELKALMPGFAFHSEHDNCNFLFRNVGLDGIPTDAELEYMKSRGIKTKFKDGFEVEA